jgi:hypothetical protein
MLEKYKCAMKKMDVPKELVEETSEKMIQQQKLLKQTNRNKKKPYLYLSFACSLILIITIFYTIHNKSNDRIILTELSPNTTIQTVNVSDGILYFNDFSEEPDNIKINQNLGIPDSLSKEWIKEEYMSYLGKTVELSYLPEGFTLEKEVVRVYENKEGIIKSDEYYTEYAANENQRIELYLRKGKLPSKSYQDLPAQSNIKNTKLSIVYREDLCSYQAQFILEDVGYYLSTENITQEEFIKILYSFFK